MDSTRKKVIKTLESLLQSMKDNSKVLSTDNNEKALEYVISSLKTDEAYQLMYEGVKHLVTIEGMTYGDVFNMIFDVDKDCAEVFGNNGLITFSFTRDKWNSPYEGADK